jgi:hypothetical protein
LDGVGQVYVAEESNNQVPVYLIEVGGQSAGIQSADLLAAVWTPWQSPISPTLSS